VFCKYCGGACEYVGVDDGGGDYGDAVCDMYRCEDCDSEFEGDCIEVDDSVDLEESDNHTYFDDIEFDESGFSL